MENFEDSENYEFENTEQQSEEQYIEEPNDSEFQQIKNKQSFFLRKKDFPINDSATSNDSEGFEDLFEPTKITEPNITSDSEKDFEELCKVYLYRNHIPERLKNNSEFMRRREEARQQRKKTKRQAMINIVDLNLIEMIMKKENLPTKALTLHHIIRIYIQYAELREQLEKKTQAELLRHLQTIK